MAFRRRFSKRTFGLIMVAGAVIGAACGSGGDSESSEPPPAERQEQQQEQQEAPAAEPAAGSQDQPGASTVPVEFAITRVDRGTKPGIAIDSDGTPLIAYLLERLGSEGWVRVARGDGSDVQQVHTGYVYGPLDITAAADGRVFVGFHDHDTEDGAVAVRDGDGWSVSQIADDGHDGWDSSIGLGPNGELYYLGVDPVQFDPTSSGVELATLSDGAWTVREVGSGAQPYEWGVDVATLSDGTVVIVYFDAESQDLVFGVDGANGFALTSIFTEGDAGRFPVLAVDQNDRAHVAFFQSAERVREEGPAPGNVMYGVQTADGGWRFETVGTVDDQVLGFAGARRTVALALNGNEPVLAYIGTERLTLARPDGSGGWSRQIVAEAEDAALQVVGLALDASGLPHLTYSTVTGGGMLDGEVWYAAPVS